ncbi:hypothetical protein Patl1_34214 [Pistacia atlantica]|uniref:Uncharacterized protein n=1 Tax=Pistacia atlantica TaxID=434234 RepID=A0ACC0ZP80_9ROSI|nr:hypothetical protein Patl1_34214 [Pistacia atlantica]
MESGQGAIYAWELCCGLDKDMGNGPYMNDSGEFLGQAGDSNDSGKFLGQVDADEQACGSGTKKPIVASDGTTTICPSFSLALEGRRKWENCLVGTFIEKKLPFHSVQCCALKLWQKYGIKEVMLNDKGFYFFKFGDEVEMMNCLEDGPWLFKNRPRLLQKWQPEMELNKEALRLIPVWVKLFDVPLEFWSPDGLSYIARWWVNHLGMDKITEDTCRFGVSRIGFARVLVEIDAARKLSESLRIRMPNEVNDESKIIGVRVDYQWRPSQCEQCCEFGHGDTSCARLPRIEDKGTRTGKTKITVVENDGFQIVNRKGKGKMPGGPKVGTNPNT